MVQVADGRSRGAVGPLDVPTSGVSRVWSLPWVDCRWAKPQRGSGWGRGDAPVCREGGSADGVGEDGAGGRLGGAGSRCASAAVREEKDRKGGD
ncbi:hypothetical protein GUJ93_ZPchr0005g15478 [Zizania palustris]|uniref:Uncharacterized protein n=1 Tax=Zizania palustris TaxID=103762 RepID=A0A8J5SWI7_ZIZPA|nr:hypothetical protein GUJ93_ZPchr0005g15478 [Zizania palustris]